MTHKEYVRICENANTVVLFIHGIAGTPNHFHEFVSLVPETVSVYNLLLDGHGESVEDFSKTSMKKWEAQVTAVVEKLSLTHEKIYIAAHSLGTLLAIGNAITNKKISSLFLLAVPLKLSVKPRMVSNSLKVYFGKVRPDDYKALAAQKSYGIGKDKNPFHYIGWIPRYMELLTKIRQTRKALYLLKTPCAVYQSKEDEVVSNKSVKYLSKNSCIRIHELEKSGHYYYSEEDFTFLLTEFSKMLNKDI